MSHLTPQKRPDRNGKMVTRHVRDTASPVAKAPLPAPSAPDASSNSQSLAVLKKLSMHFGSEDGASYFSYIGRQPTEYREAIMTAVMDAQTSQELDAVMCVLGDGSGPVFPTLALDNPSFIVELAKQQTVIQASGTKVYSAAVMVMDQSFREHFNTRSIPIDEAGIRKYAPLLRAASITKTLGIDQNALTSFDKVDQMRHVNDNSETFMRHLLACRSVTLHAGDAMFTSEDLLGICEVLDAHPGSDDVLMKYVSDRKRYDPDEFKLILSGASRSLSEGTL